MSRFALRLQVLVGILLLVTTTITIAHAGFVDRSAPHPLNPTSLTLADVIALHAKTIGTPTVTETTRVEEWTYSEGALEGVQSLVESGAGYRIVTTFGPIVSQSGMSRGIRWRQDENGITVLMSGVHHERESLQTALDAAARGQQGESVKLLGESSSPDAYVIQVNPPGGRLTWLFYDKTSGLRVRMEELLPTKRRTTTYSGFRKVNGVAMAGAVRIHYGNPADDVSATLRSVSFNVPVNPNDLDVPPNRRALVDFPSGVTAVALPSTVHKETGVVIIRVTISGRGYDLQLDSGADGIYFDDSVVGELGLRRYGTFSQENGSKTFTGMAIVPEMRIGDLVMKNVVVNSMPFEFHDKEAKVVGLIGYDLLASLGLKVDYDHAAVTAYPLGTIPIPNRAFTLPVVLDDGVPMVGVTIGQTASDRFILDTGAFDVVIFPGFARQHPSDVADQGLGRQVQERTEHYLGTVYGVVETVPTQLRHVVFGADFNEYLGFLVAPDSVFNFEDTDGALGYHLLRFYNLYFDYFHAQIVLEPNSSYYAEAHRRK